MNTVIQFVSSFLVSIPDSAWRPTFLHLCRLFRRFLAPRRSFIRSARAARSLIPPLKDLSPRQMHSGSRVGMSLTVFYASRGWPFVPFSEIRGPPVFLPSPMER